LKKKSLLGISLLVILGLVYFISPSSSDLSYDPSRFVFKQLCNQLNEPIELEIFNNGNVLLIERRGNLQLYNEKKDTIQSAGKIAVGYSTETGLLGLALDPNFVDNHWIIYSIPTQ